MIRIDEVAIRYSGLVANGVLAVHTRDLLVIRYIAIGKYVNNL